MSLNTEKPLKKKVGMISLGCPKNLVDSEVMLGILKNRGYEITNQSEKADILIINTCSFIEEATQESINTVLEYAEASRKNDKILVVTGCMAERFRDEIFKEIPEVDVVLGTGSCSLIADAIEQAIDGKKISFYEKLADDDFLERDRILSISSGYAYLKIAEGCNNCCTYCIIPKLRGKYRSRSMESIVSEAKELAKNGVREVILIAQDTTNYGTDIYGKLAIVDLIRELSRIDGIEWIRLLYCYPELITDDLIREFAENEKLCKYIDIPIQHISDRILKLMGRRGGSETVLNVLEKLRERVPDIILRTTLIVGFPGETDEDFEILYNFVGRQRFDRLGVFTYSREEGTPAAEMKNQVPDRIKLSRYNRIMALQKQISAEVNRKRMNRVYRTLVQGVADDGIFYYGRTYGESPDIDGVIYFTSTEPLDIGSFVNVRILNTEQYDLIGEVIYESAE